MMKIKVIVKTLLIVALVASSAQMTAGVEKQVAETDVTDITSLPKVPTYRSEVMDWFSKNPKEAAGAIMAAKLMSRFFVTLYSKLKEAHPEVEKKYKALERKAMKAIKAPAVDR